MSAAGVVALVVALVVLVLLVVVVWRFESRYRREPPEGCQ
jgi:hypothetical protein